jgi:acyl-coenzyme A synthetase/AMP-(fatty) acid ligase
VQYQDTDIRYDQSTGERLAFITHTSGTTHGTRKMLPFSDKVFNDILNLIPNGNHAFLPEPDNGKPLRCLMAFDFSSIMALSSQVHWVFAYGDTVVMTFFGFMHPKFVRAVDYYSINNLGITGFMVDKWMERSDLEDVNFASLKVLGLSGGYISPEKLEKYKAFFKAHGYRYDITQGYAMSEAGGKPVFSKQGQRADVLGEFDNPEEYRVRDENDGQFYRLGDGPRTGILYRYNETRCSNQLDGEILFEYTEIDGKEFLCTNDLVRVNEDGSVSFAGRSDKYFVNNEGRKFDSGVVEVQMAGCSAVSNCAVVPVFEKRIHDTVPVLYVVPAVKGQDAPQRIRQAFVDVYVQQKKLPADHLPSQFMLVDEIPLNANGKLDIFRITRERINGDAYNLVPEMENGSLTDIRVEHVKKLNSMTAGTLPQGMENNSAYNVFDLFNAVPSEKKCNRGIFPELSDLTEKLLPNIPKKKKALELPRIPEPWMKKLLIYGNRISGIPEGRKWMNFDFED